jgi:hypothetical protein
MKAMAGVGRWDAARILKAYHTDRMARMRWGAMAKAGAQLPFVLSNI